MPKMPEPLPEDFTWGPFRYREAAEVGIPRSRLRQKDVIHAHHGIYVAAAAGPRNIVERCETLLPLLGERRWFSHGTAARLWGMPLPARESDDEVLHVLSVAGAQRMRRPGVRGWESAEPEPAGTVVGLLPIIQPAIVWGQLAASGSTEHGVSLSREWLVAVGDYLLTGPRRDGRRHPLCTRDELADVVARARGRRGARSLSWALDRVRAPVDSPKETQLRLGLIRCGLPEPVVQQPVWTAKGWRHADLGYPSVNQLLEYQGEEHRTSKSRWREDLTRVQLFQDAGWRVLLVGADDVDDAAAGEPLEGFGSEPGTGLQALAERVRRALDGRAFG